MEYWSAYMEGVRKIRSAVNEFMKASYIKDKYNAQEHGA